MSSITTRILSLLVCVLIILIPWGFSNSFVQPQTGQLFILIMATPVALVFILLKLFKARKQLNLNITKTDLVLIFLMVVVLIQMLVQHQTTISHVLGLISYSMLYLLIRSLTKKHTIIFFCGLLVAGIAQAVYGNLQLYDIYPSHHGLFKMTGSFFNPGPYAGYLVSIIPLAITLFLIKYTTHFKIKYKDLSGAEIPAPNESHNLNEPGQRVKLSPKLIFLKVKKITYKNWPYLIQYLIGIAIITILLVLPASKSRAAWLATIGAVFFIFIQIWQDELMVNTILFRGKWKFKSGKILSSTLAKILGILIIIVLLAGGLFATYKMKQGSANGRLLIWKVSSEIIKDKPLLGHGINAFEAKYMDYQAKYFQANPESEESFLADNTKYAFNELIRIATETGLIGLILSILLLWFLLFGKPVDISKQEKIELIALRTTLMALIIFGLFSYPDEIIPIKLNLIVIVALISNYLVPVKFLSKRNIKLQLPDNTIQKRRTIGIVTKSLISCALIAGTTYYINCGIRLYKANTNWKIAFTTYQMGAYSACIENYENAFPYLQYDGDFLLNYGKALSMAEEHKKAVEVLEYTKNYYPNTVLQTALGDSYKALGQIKKSEEAYLQASWMIPSKFYPKYLLAKLYDETGQDEKATQVATELLSKKVKIESTAIKEIQQEMRAIITRNQNST